MRAIIIIDTIKSIEPIVSIDSIAPTDNKQ